MSNLHENMIGLDDEHAFAVNLMRHLVVPTFVVDAACNVLIWNKACERLTGVPAKDIVGTRDHWRAFYDAPRPCLADLVALGRISEAKDLYAAHDHQSVMACGVYAENWYVMPRIGNELYLAVDAGPIYDEDGQLVAVVETLRDMTDHRRAQLALEKLASSDGLTGVANRRCFDERLNLEWRRARRDLKNLSLLMIDVDHFKCYNDTYGHQAGDHCLQQIVAALEYVALRPGDLVARYGGEEFAVILSDTDSNGAAIVAGRIIARMNELNLPHAGGVGGRVTLSIGLSSVVPTAELLPTELIATADAALYQAKHRGRNGFVSPPLQSTPPLIESPATACGAVQ